MDSQSSNATATTPKASTASKVFGTYELLEAILYQFPVRDILLAQTVDKQFRKVIAGSNKLQHALFLKPIPVDPMEDRHGNIKVRKNPLLEQLFLRLPNHRYGRSCRSYYNDGSDYKFEKQLLAGDLTSRRALHDSWKLPKAS